MALEKAQVLPYRGPEGLTRGRDEDGAKVGLISNRVHCGHWALRCSRASTVLTRNEYHVAVQFAGQMIDGSSVASMGRGFEERIFNKTNETRITKAMPAAMKGI